MNGKFKIYALVVSLLCTSVSWTKMLSGGTEGGSGRRGNSWSSYSGGSWGGGSGGGGHK